MEVGFIFIIKGVIGKNERAIAKRILYKGNFRARRDFSLDKNFFFANVAYCLSS